MRISQNLGGELAQAPHENTAGKQQEVYQVNILICTSHFFFLQTITLLFKLTFSCKIFISFFQQNLYKGKNKILFWQLS